MQFVVRIALERIAMQRECFHLLLGNQGSGRVEALVELGLHAKPRFGSGVADQVDNALAGAQRLAAPVARDMAEQAMLDLVPLAGPGRKVTDADPPSTPRRRTSAASSWCPRKSPPGGAPEKLRPWH